MSNTETRYFNIADHNIKVVFVDNEKNNMSLLRSYFPFLIPPVSDDELLFTMIKKNYYSLRNLDSKISFSMVSSFSGLAVPSAI